MLFVAFYIISEVLTIIYRNDKVSVLCFTAFFRSFVIAWIAIGFFTYVNDYCIYKYNIKDIELVKTQKELIDIQNDILVNHADCCDVDITEHDAEMFNKAFHLELKIDSLYKY